MPAGFRFGYFVIPREGNNYFAESEHFCEVDSYVHGGILKEQEQMDGHRIITYKEMEQKPVNYQSLKDLDGNEYNTKYLNIEDLNFDSLNNEAILFVNKGMFEAEKIYGIDNIKNKLEELKNTHKIASFFHIIY